MSIEIPIAFPGTTESTEQLNQLVRAMVDLGLAESQVSEAQRELTQQTQVTLSAQQLAAAAARGVAQAQQAQRDAAIATTAAERGAAAARQEYNERTREAARAQQQATQEQTRASTEAIQFATRIAGAANAVQTLVSQLGGTGRAAGLVGAVANSTAHFAQLGAAVGPGGAVVGGIVGALIPAIQSLRRESDDAATAAANLNADLATLIQRAEQARQQTELLRRLENGEGSVTEQGAYQQRSVDRQELTRRALAGDAGAIRALRQQGVTGHADDYGTFDAITDAVDRATGGTGTVSTQLTESERAILTANFDAHGREATRRGTLLAESVDRQYDQSAIASAGRTARARGGGGNSARRGSNAGVRGRPQSGEELDAIGEQQAISEQNAALERQVRIRQELAQQREHAEEQESRQAEAENQRAELLEQQMQAIREKDEAADRVAQGRHQKDEQDKAAQQEARQQQAREYQQTTGAIVGAVVEAGVAMASGQESASEAFKHMLASFLAYISQRSALEAASEYAQAIASFARYDYSGGAQHAAAGVAFTAVAIAAGVGSGALNASAAQEAAARKNESGGGRDSGPARVPSKRSSDEGGGPKVVNVLFNSAVVTANTTDELGRRLGRMVASSAVRHPSD